ncbi:hypothetical protein GWQ44_09650 [Pseudomonas sp. 3MA1]|uniref:hypothetical protein n=1 Tax=Pseudomonas sp. 3MA1 TaxID=2699196 RepID=UPI0023DD68C9|nr:hypothetical protein [Pseudomonas sp. 3MA1]MDF2395799.1 hypothetical protein [Pseudomonas sp. 3MA1]
MSEKEKYATWKRLHEAEGQLVYHLAVFGDKLAKREKYKSLEGLDAVRFYLVHKFSWPPAQVRSMSYEDIQFVLQEEMEGFVLPASARVAKS